MEAYIEFMQHLCSAIAISIGAAFLIGVVILVLAIFCCLIVYEVIPAFKEGE